MFGGLADGIIYMLPFIFFVSVVTLSIISLLVCDDCLINRMFVNSWVLNTDMMRMRCLKATQKKKLLEQETTGDIL